MSVMLMTFYDEHPTVSTSTEGEIEIMTESTEIETMSVTEAEIMTKIAIDTVTDVDNFSQHCLCLFHVWILQKHCSNQAYEYQW